MTWTKRQFIVAALEQIGIPENLFSIQPNMLEVALRRLDSMMADWNARGIRLGYPLSSIENSSVSQETGVPDSANEAIIDNLALRIAPAYGKQVSREVKVAAKNGINTLLMRSGTLQPDEMQFPDTLPYGQGNKPFRYGKQNYFPIPSDPVDAGPDSVLDFN